MSSSPDPGVGHQGGDIDELGLLGCRAVDLLGDVGRDEAADFPVDSGDDAQDLAPDRLRRDMHGDIRGPGFGDVDDDEQRLGGARGGPQRDVPVDDESLLVQPQVDDQFDDQRDADREGDGLAKVAPHVRLLNLHLRSDLGQPAWPLRHRTHLEFIAGDLGEGRGDALLGHRFLEEPASEIFVGDEVVRLHRDLQSHPRRWTPERGTVTNRLAHAAGVAGADLSGNTQIGRPDAVVGQEIPGRPGAGDAAGLEDVGPV